MATTKKPRRRPIYTLKALILHHSCGMGIEYCQDLGWNLTRILNPLRQTAYDRRSPYGCGWPAIYILDFVRYEMSDRADAAGQIPRRMTDDERAMEVLRDTVGDALTYHAGIAPLAADFAKANAAVRKALKLADIDYTTPPKAPIKGQKAKKK